MRREDMYDLRRLPGFSGDPSLLVKPSKFVNAVMPADQTHVRVPVRFLFPVVVDDPCPPPTLDDRATRGAP